MPQRVVIDYNKLCIMVILASIVYNEYFAYFSHYASWPKIPIKKISIDNPDRGKSDEEILRILYVADSQIQGYLNEGSTGPIKRWDIDRYLSKTYSWAMYAYAPQVVVFLGDLIDEGSEADEDDYLDYVIRFKNIYSLKTDKSSATSYTDKTKAIFVPGDNDIGGEGSDRVTKAKIERFQKHFPSQLMHTFREKAILEIISVDALSEIGRKDTDVTFAGFPEQLQHDQEVENKPIFRMIVSHWPITPLHKTSFGQKVLQTIKPSVIFSAHDHRGELITALNSPKGISHANVTSFSQKTLDMFQNHPKDQPAKSDFYSMNIYSNVAVKPKNGDDKAKQEAEDVPDSMDENSNFIREIVVPTCSYRMGVKEMAFGLAVINLNSVKSNKDDVIEIFYANLWLPSRFALLFVYVAALISSLAIFLVGRIQKFRRGRRDYPGSWRSKRRSSSNSPSPHRRSTSRGRSNYSKLV